MSYEGRVLHFEYPTAPAISDTEVCERHGWEMEPEGRQQRDQALREAQAREIGRMEGEARAKVQSEEALRREHALIETALHEFASERQRYFEQVEAEVVSLALAIARKVLHREAQIDTDLLTGLVRYTLEKLNEGTRMRLRIHPSRGAQWEKMFGDSVQLCPDEKMERDRCLIETEIGTTAVSVDDQLKEIEQGLMDLIAHRPEGV